MKKAKKRKRGIKQSILSLLKVERCENTDECIADTILNLFNKEFKERAIGLLPEKIECYSAERQAGHNQCVDQGRKNIEK